MKTHALHAQMSHTQHQQMLRVMESILVFVFCLFVSIMLPTLLVRYLYSADQLFAQPKLLEYLPVASFAIGVGYFVYVILMNLLANRQIRRMASQLQDDNCADCDCDHHHSDLDQMSDLVDEALAKNKVKTRKVRRSGRRK